MLPGSYEESIVVFLLFSIGMQPQDLRKKFRDSGFPESPVC